MVRIVSIISSFIAGFLLFSAWAGYVEDEFHVKQFQGLVVEKLRYDTVLDIGSTIYTQPRYKVVLSSGNVLNVPYSIYKKLNKGDYTVLLKQKDHIILLQ